MNKIIYFILATPFMLLAKLSQFFVWELIDTHWKIKSNERYPHSNNDQSGYIQVLLKKVGESKKHEEELHDYYARQLKQKDATIRRLSLNR